MMPKEQDPGPGQTHDPETGEVIEREDPLSMLPHEAQRPPALDSFVRLLQAVEGGDLNEELSRELRDLGARMVAMAANYGGKQKGKIVLTLDFTLNKAELNVASKVKIERPMPPRGDSHFWVTGEGRITQTNPKQMDMFGKGAPRAV